MSLIFSHAMSFGQWSLHSFASYFIAIILLSAHRTLASTFLPHSALCPQDVGL